VHPGAEAWSSYYAEAERVAAANRAEHDRRAKAAARMMAWVWAVVVVIATGVFFWMWRLEM
jgi:hypothetical protein